MIPAAVLRVVLAAAAIALAVFGVLRVHDDHACTSAATQAFALGEAKATTIAQARPVAKDLEDHCRGSQTLANAAAALSRGAAAPVARELAAEAVHREPRSATAWISVAFARRATDPAAARTAQRHALRLDPYVVRVVAP
jgi:hypothetical protein